MIHHKYINNKEIISSDISISITEISVTLNRNSTKYFESKVKYYYRVMNPKSTCVLINVITGMVEKPTLEKIMSGINIRFKFFVNTFNKKLMRGDVKIINEDTIHPFKL